MYIISLKNLKSISGAKFHITKVFLFQPK